MASFYRHSCCRHSRIHRTCIQYLHTYLHTVPPYSTCISAYCIPAYLRTCIRTCIKFGLVISSLQSLAHAVLQRKPKHEHQHVEAWFRTTHVRTLHSQSHSYVVLARTVYIHTVYLVISLPRISYRYTSYVYGSGQPYSYMCTSTEYYGHTCMYLHVPSSHTRTHNKHHHQPQQQFGRTLIVHTHNKHHHPPQQFERTLIVHTHT